MDEPIAPGRIPINLAIQVGFWIVAAMLTYTAVVARVSVVESSVLATERRLDRIETKVDQLLDREREHR